MDKIETQPLWGSGGGDVLISCIAASRMAIDPSFNAGTDHVGFLMAWRTSRAPSANRREVFGESREG